MAWSRTSKTLTKLPTLLAAGRLKFDFDEMPLEARGLSWKCRINLLKSGLSGALNWAHVPGLPPALQIEPTNRCDLQCPLCPTGGGTSERATGTMRMETFNRILDQVGDVLVFAILYGWGEPLLHPQFPRMVQKCSERNIKTLTSTNGQHLQTMDEALALVDAGLDALIIAMDGSRQETYETYRRGGQLDRVRRCTEMIEAAKTHRGSALPYTNLRAVVTSENEEQLQEIRSFARDAGVNMFAAKTLGCQPDTDTYSDFQATREDMDRFGGDRTRRNCQTPINCPFPFRQPTVFWDGMVVGCEFDHELEQPWGRVGEDNFNELWNSAEARHLRATTTGAAPGPRLCSRCPYRGRVRDGSTAEKQELRPA